MPKSIPIIFPIAVMYYVLLKISKLFGEIVFTRFVPLPKIGFWGENVAYFNKLGKPICQLYD